MNGIHTLILKNFKAFPEEQKFEFNGKHILMYGENGSGKSSIYWGLYTILQSSIRGKDVAKYFIRASEHSLLNTHTTDDDAFIHLSFKDTPDQWHKLTANGLENPPVTVNALADANLTSDFLSYRLMTSIYNFRHSEVIDLFPVFEKDIIPFMQTAAQENWNDLYKKIINRRPYAQRGASNELRSSKVPNVNQYLKSYTDEILVINGLIKGLISKLLECPNGEGTPNMLSVFYNQYFAEPGEEFMIDLVFQDMKYEWVNYTQPSNKGDLIFKSKDYRELIKPVIRLQVFHKVKGIFEPVNRPQSFFNEARLTRIALCIRLCVFETRKNDLVDTKFLALDDLLISLDMSNREAVLDLIFERYINSHQIIILTHERAFFHLAKRKIEYVYNLNEWKLLEIYEHQKNEIAQPLVLDYRSPLALAEQHFREKKDYPATANYLRSHLEGWISRFVPSLQQRSKKGEIIKLFNGLLAKANEYFDKLGLDKAILDRLNIYRETLLNPLSHYDNAFSEVYKKDLEAILKIAYELEGIKNNPISKVNELLLFTVQTKESGAFQLYLRLLNDFRLIKDVGKASWAEQTLSIQQEFQILPDGTHHDFNPKRQLRNKTLKEIFDDYCNGIKKFERQTPIPESDMYVVFKNDKGMSLREIIRGMY